MCDCAEMGGGKAGACWVPGRSVYKYQLQYQLVGIRSLAVSLLQVFNIWAEWARQTRAEPIRLGCHAFPLTYYIMKFD